MDPFIPCLRQARRPTPGTSTRTGRVHLVTVLAVLVSVVGLAAQTTTRRLTTIESLQQFPGYFHLQNVLLRGEFVERGVRLVLHADGRDLSLLNPEQARRGPVEVRGQLLDVGRLERGDLRLGSFGERLGAAQWPRPGEELVLNVTGVADAPPAVTPSVRAVALEPWKFEGQTITVTGSFRGRNLLGDLPAAPGKSPFDFILGGAEGAVWVTGLRPRGRGFDLDVDRRMDTNRWVQVTGTVGRERGLVTISAKGIALADEPKVSATAPEPDATAPTPLPPAEVVFSSPTADETDVPPGTTIRIQFSRGLRGASLADHVRVSYLGASGGDAPPEFQATYDPATRSVQIKFARPLEPFRTVKVELLQGITAFDGGPFTPSSFTFSLGR